MSATIAVPIGPCLCPGTPHADGDVVELRERLGLAGGVELQRRVVDANKGGNSDAELAGQLAEAYIRVGVAAWNLVDSQGKPVPLNMETLQLHLLDDFERSAIVADKADDMYMTVVIGPLVQRAATSSPSTTTNRSTSPMDGGSPKRPKRSRRSSTSTTPMDAITTTSP